MGGSHMASRTCSSLGPLGPPFLRGHLSWDPKPRPTMGLTATVLGQRVFLWAHHRGWLLPKWGPRLALTWGHLSRSTCSRHRSSSHRPICTSSRQRTPCITSLHRPSSSSRSQRTSSSTRCSSSSRGPRRACLQGRRASLCPGTPDPRMGRPPASRGCPCSPRRLLVRP